MLRHPCSQRYFDQVYVPMNFGPRGPMRRIGSRFFRTTASAIASYCVDLLRASPPKSLLDLGCGTGALLADIAATYPLERAVGVDFSASSIGLAETRLTDRNCYTFERAAVEQCHALRESYDAVLAIGLFDYLEFDAELLGAMLSATRMTLIITVPRRRFGWQRLARRVWLGMHGVRLWAYGPREIEEIRAQTPEAKHFHWACMIPALMPDNQWLIAHRHSAP